MNLIQQLQNFNIVETSHCDLIQNGTHYELRSYSTPAKREQDVTGTHKLYVRATTPERLQAHWDGFVEIADAQNLVTRRNALDGHRFSVIFYGGWYVTDTECFREVKADSFEQAVQIAEHRNTTENV